MTDENWDWKTQKDDTIGTIEMLAAEAGLTPDNRITLDLEFAPASDTPDRNAFVKALASFGYTVGEDPDGDEVTAHIDDIPFSLDAIWAHEERTTKLALSRGYEPDGWGFWEP